MERHADLARQASEGHGCDRHLLGLQILAAETGTPTPDIFTDPMWKKRWETPTQCEAARGRAFRMTLQGALCTNWIFNTMTADGRRRHSVLRFGVRGPKVQIALQFWLHALGEKGRQT